MYIDDNCIDDFTESMKNFKLSILCEAQLCEQFKEGSLGELHFLKFLELIGLASIELQIANKIRRESEKI